MEGNKERLPTPEAKKEEEIERSFLVRKLPEDLESFPSVELITGYLEVSKERDDRIRREGSKYTRETKIGVGAERTEET